MLAANIAETINTRVSGLGAHPWLGRPLRKQFEFRELVFRALNGMYAVRYRVAKDRVVILRVYHTREQRD